MPSPYMSQATAAPAAPTPQASGGGQTAVTTAAPAPIAPPGSSAHDIYMALRAARRELISQRDALDEQRQELVGRLREGTVSDGDRAGIEQRLAVIDQQLAAKQIAIGEAEAQVAVAASVPGATIEPPSPPEPFDVGDFMEMSFVVGTILAFPIVLAWARRIWRKSSVTINLPAELTDRLTSLERSVDTVAIEVERIGEGQRFVTQLMGDRARPAAELARGKGEGHV